MDRFNRVMWSYRYLNRSRLYHTQSFLSKCGVLSYFPMSPYHPVITQQEESKFVKALSTLKHRGPDNSSVWVEKKRKVALGHTRLAVIGLDDGNQPLSSIDGKVHTIINGELYDFERIKQELQKNDGTRFLTHTDSEIAIPLYQKYGVDFPKYLRGEFAVIIYDEYDNTLYAARDRFGIKPLFYAKTHDGKLVVASEIKAILAMGVPAKWNLKSLAHTSYVLHNETVFEGIHQVPPAHILIAKTDGSITLQQYWEVKYPSRQETESDSRSESELIESVSKTLMESIRHRLRADVPVAVYLSGGLDSCAILGMASSISQSKLDAFSISFLGHQDFDEGMIAKRMAQHCGANFHVVEITGNNIAEHVDQSIWCTETPINNSNGVAKFILSKNVRQNNIKVVLTGEGSDEIFAGYSWFRQDIINHYMSKGILSTENASHKINALQSKNRVMPSGFGTNYKLVEEYLGFCPSFFSVLSPESPFYSNDFMKKFPTAVAEKGLKSIKYLQENIKGPDFKKIDELHVSMYTFMKTFLANIILVYLGDRNEMANSVEGRLPFLDHNLVELANGLPPKIKISPNLEEKYILKQVAKPFITEEVYKRQKHPFYAPMYFLEKGSKLNNWLQENIRHHSVKNLYWLDQDKLIKTLDDMDLESMDVRDMILLESGLVTVASMISLHRQFNMS